MKKMVLVPEVQFRQMQQNTLKNSSSSSSNNSSLLGAIDRPVQQEMVKKFNFAQQILNDPTKPSDGKISEYTDAMSEFATLRNKIKGAPNLSSVTPKTMGNSNKVSEDVVNSVPASLQSSAQRLMERMGENKDVISWTPSGAVTINGQHLVGTHIADLVGDVVRSSQSPAPERNRFLRMLAELNTPESLIKNREALKQYRLIKDGSFIAHPPGIPRDQIDSTEDHHLPAAYEESEFSKPFKRSKSTTTTTTSSLPPRKKLKAKKSSIRWVRT